jgi:hypothetical protein
MVEPEAAHTFVREGASFQFTFEGSVEAPEEMDAEFRLSSVRGAPGFPVTVPFSINANAATQGFSFSIDFDEDVLRGSSVERLHQTPAGNWGFWKYHIDNANETPGNGGVDEGYIAGGAVFSFENECSNIPANTPTDVLAFHFDVLPETSASGSELRFLDGGRTGGGSASAASNQLWAFGTPVGPELASSFVFINGLVAIAPDISVFVRGDSNGDGRVDVSDARRTLGYLFLGEAAPACLDAADANDDGIILITDPIFTLNYLFTGGKALPPPNPAEGEDPTEDALGCLFQR